MRHAACDRKLPLQLQGSGVAVRVHGPGTYSEIAGRTPQLRKRRLRRYFFPSPGEYITGNCVMLDPSKVLILLIPSLRTSSIRMMEWIGR